MECIVEQTYRQWRSDQQNVEGETVKPINADEAAIDGANESQTLTNCVEI